MVSFLAADNLGEVEVGSVDCAGSNRIKTFCGFLMYLAGQPGAHHFLSCFLDI